MVLSLFLSAQGQVEHQYTIEDEQPTAFSPDTETADGVEPEPLKLQDAQADHSQTTDALEYVPEPGEYQPEVTEDQTAGQADQQGYYPSTSYYNDYPAYQPDATPGEKVLYGEKKFTVHIFFGLQLHRNLEEQSLRPS